MSTKSKNEKPTSCAAKEAVEDILRGSYDCKNATYVNYWKSPTKKYFKLYFNCDFCDFCNRKHDRPQLFLQQYFPEINKETGEAEPPLAYIGCNRVPNRLNGRKITFIPIAYDLLEVEENKKPY